MARQRHFTQRGTLVAPWGRGGIGIRRRLKIFGLRDCGFESHRPYHRESIGGSTRPAFLCPSHRLEPAGQSCGGGWRSDENARVLPSAVRKARNAQRDEALPPTAHPDDGAQPHCCQPPAPLRPSTPPHCRATGLVPTMKRCGPMVCSGTPAHRPAVHPNDEAPPPTGPTPAPPAHRPRPALCHARRRCRRKNSPIFVPKSTVYRLYRYASPVNPPQLKPSRVRSKG